MGAIQHILESSNNRFKQYELNCTFVQSLDSILLIREAEQETAKYATTDMRRAVVATMQRIRRKRKSAVPHKPPFHSTNVTTIIRPACSVACTIAFQLVATLSAFHFYQMVLVVLLPLVLLSLFSLALPPRLQLSFPGLRSCLSAVASAPFSVASSSPISPSSAMLFLSLPPPPLSPALKQQCEAKPSS
eukprot:693380-Hanusia_phi.AAC.4